jgi:HK97 family phage portal protein
MNIFGRKSAGRAPARPAHFGVQLGRAYSAPVNPLGEWPRSYEAQVRDLYLTNAVAQRAVRLVAEGVASLPLSSSDPLALSLVTTTSGGQSLLETLAAHLLLHGNGYVQLLSGADGVPCELYGLRPERMTIEPDARGWPSAFLYRAGQAVTRLPSDSVIHIRTHHPLDDHYGLGCLGAASGPIAIHNAATKWNKALLDNAARPSGALVYEPGEAGAVLSGEQFDRLKAEMEASFAGAVNAGKPMLLEGGLRWQSMSLSPTDMDFIALKGAAARDIALAFGVPPMLLGLPGDATYANYREANKALFRLAILPLAGKLLAAISEGLRTWFAGLELTVDLDAVGALSEDRERLWAQVSAADFLTLDEKRALVGYEAVVLDEGDAPPPAPEPVLGPETLVHAPPEALTDLKYNHVHDKFGLFTSAGQGVPSGGGSFGSGGTTAMAKPPAKTKLPPAAARTADRHSTSNRPTITNNGPKTITIEAQSNQIRTSDRRTITNRATATYREPNPISGPHDQSLIIPIPGYGETGKDDWRASNDQVFIDAVNNFNRENKLTPDNPRFQYATTLKAQAMVESGGSKEAFLRDPLQVNNHGDEASDKQEVTGIAPGQVMTPDLSAAAALKWVDHKSFYRPNGAAANSPRIYRGRAYGIRQYNGRKDKVASEGGIEHRDWYVDRVLWLSIQASEVWQRVNPLIPIAK